MDTMATSAPETLLGNMDVLLLRDDTSGNFMAAQNSVYLGLQALIKSGNLYLARAAVEAWANDPLKLNVGPAAYELVAMTMDKNAPESTAAWLRSLPITEDRNSAIETFVASWGQNDPPAAMHWAEKLAPQEGQPEAVGRVFIEWMQNDAGAAINWLDDYIPRSATVAEGDDLIGSMILFSPTAKSNPKEALKLADSIDNPESRLIYQEQVFQSWARTDPGAAVEYVMNSTTIASDQRELLFQQILEANKQANAPNQPEQ